MNRDGNPETERQHGAGKIRPDASGDERKWSRVAAGVAAAGEALSPIANRVGGPVTKKAILGSVVVVVVALTVVPLAFLLWTSVWSGAPGQFDAHLTLEKFATVYLGGNFDVPGLLYNSVRVAVGMTLTGLVAGLLFAWLFARTNVPTKGAMELVLLSGQAVPAYVYAIVYVFSYGPTNGFVTTLAEETLGFGVFPLDIYGIWGISFVVGVSVIPTFYLLTVPALQDMDPALEEVGRVHGASVFGTVRSISFPLIKPAILSAALVTFLYGLGEFAIVKFLGARRGIDVYSTAVHGAIKDPSNSLLPKYGEAAALSASLLVVTLVLVWYYRRVTDRKEDFMTLTGQGHRTRTWDLGRWRWPTAGLLWAILLVVWVLPLVVMVLVSLQPTWSGQPVPAAMGFESYAAVLGDATVRGAFVNSVLVAVGGASFGTVLVVGLAYYTERTTAPLRGLADFLSMTPLAVPGIIMGVALVFSALWLGKVHPLLDVYGTLVIIAVGSVIVFVPVSSRIAVGNVVQIHTDLEEAARIYGASWVRQMREVFLPLFSNTAAVIWFFLLIHVFQLLTIALMTYSTGTIVIPVELFSRYYTDAALNEVAAISTVLVGMTVAVILALRRAGVTFYQMGRR
ncbi:MAG: iron ABC transporter permease [Halobacteriales archaeon]